MSILIWLKEQLFWGPGMLLLILGTGFYLMVGLRLYPLRRSRPAPTGCSWKVVISPAGIRLFPAILTLSMRQESRFVEKSSLSRRLMGMNSRSVSSNGH